MCGCCSDVFYCNKACQCADYTRIHRHERETNKVFGATYTATQDGEIDREHRRDETPKRSVTKLNKLMELARAFKIEYNRTAELTTIAVKKERERLANVRSQFARSSEEKARLDRLERVTERREKAEKWSMHDDYDKMIEMVRSITTESTGKPTSIGDYERLRMTYTKRQLSLLHLKKRLGMATHDVGILEEAFQLETQIRDETDRFIHEWLIGSANQDYDETQKYIKETRRNSCMEIFIEQQWDAITNSVAMQMTGYIHEASIGGSSVAKLQNIDTVVHRNTTMMTMDAMCTTYVASFDLMMERQVQSGTESEETRLNTTKFIRDTYSTLRVRITELVDNLTASLSDASSSRFGSFGGKEGVDNSGTTQTENDEKSIAGKFKEKMSGLLPDWIPSIIGIGMVIGFVVLLLSTLATTLTTTMYNSTMHVALKTDPSATNITTIVMKDIDNRVVKRETLDREIAECYNALTIKEVNQCIMDKGNALHMAVGSLEGHITSYTITTNVMNEATDIDKLMDGTRYQLGLNNVEGPQVIINDAMSKLDEIATTDLSVKRIMDMSDADLANPQYRPIQAYATTQRNIIYYAKEYQMSFDGEHRNKALGNLIDVIRFSQKDGIKSGNNALNQWTKDNLVILSTIQKVADEVIIPQYNELRKEISSGYDAYQRANSTVATRRDDLEKKQTECIEATTRWDARRLASEYMIGSMWSNVILGSCSAFLFANGLTRTVAGFVQLCGNIVSHALSCMTKGLSWPTGLSCYSFITGVFVFIVALQSVRTFFVQLPSLPFIGPIVDEISRRIIMPSGRVEELHSFANDNLETMDKPGTPNQKKRTVDQQLMQLTLAWESDEIDHSTYAFFTEMILDDKLELFKEDANQFFTTNPVAVMLNYMTSNLYMRMKYSSSSNTRHREFTKMELILRYFSNARLIQAAMYAAVFSMIYVSQGAYATVTSLYSLTTTGFTAWGILSAFNMSAVFKAVGTVIGTTAPYLALRQIQSETKKRDDQLTSLHENENWYDKAYRHMCTMTFILATMTHSFLIQSGIKLNGDVTYEKFLNDNTLIDILLSGTQSAKEWVPSGLVDQIKWIEESMLFLQDTPESAYTNIPEIEKQIKKFDSQLTEATKEVKRLQYAGANTMTRYKEIYSNSTNFIRFTGNETTMYEKENYLRGIGYIKSDVPRITPNPDAKQTIGAK